MEQFTNKILETTSYGVFTISAFQNEGAFEHDGKGSSIWDVFTARKGKVKDGTHARVATDFYNRYYDDLLLTKQMGFRVFRFSISWARILQRAPAK